MKLKKTVWAVAGAAALAMASLPAHADKKEWTQKIVALQQPAVEDLARSIAEQPARQLAAAVRPVLMQGVPEDKREAAAKQVDAEIKKYLEAATPILRSTATKLSPGTVSPVLEEKFSEDELKQLAGILDSPVLKKYQAMLPELSNALLEKTMAEARPQVTPKIQAAEANIRKILDTATGGKLSGSAPLPEGPDASTPTAKPAAKPAAKK